jgi:hypothetical protein
VGHSMPYLDGTNGNQVSGREDARPAVPAAPGSNRHRPGGCIMLATPTTCIPGGTVRRWAGGLKPGYGHLAATRQKLRDVWTRRRTRRDSSIKALIPLPMIPLPAIRLPGFHGPPAASALPLSRPRTAVASGHRKTVPTLFRRQQPRRQRIRPDSATAPILRRQKSQAKT